MEGLAAEKAAVRAFRERSARAIAEQLPAIGLQPGLKVMG
jgi:hypothetical protein